MFYAKSEGRETLKQHTDRLIDNYNILKHHYGEKIEKIAPIDGEVFWRLLYYGVFYHDFGKTYTVFQNIIREKIGLEKLDTHFGENIPHNYLSPAFLPFDELEEYDKDTQNALIQAIGFHHERDSKPDFELIIRIINEDLYPKLDSINYEMGTNIEILDMWYLDQLQDKNRIREGDKNYRLYVLLKGFLHRLDHSASAHIDTEINKGENASFYVVDYIENKLNGELRDVQLFTSSKKDENLILVASTGIGKTEASLMWVGEDKAFFTLPLRVTLNSLYSRVREEIGYENLGLLHSTSLDYLESSGYEDSLQIYNNSKQLSNKINFTTVDQIFPFTFKYKGYEKIYSSLLYSKIIIDEIQAYSPIIAASILKGIEMIYGLGGRFLIMTATLPRIYKEYLQDRGITFEQKIFPSDMNRHKLSIVDCSILDDIDRIVEKGKTNKVLVIANTVNRAFDIYNAIRHNNLDMPVKLLHSMFIQRDRRKLEQQIEEFAKGDEPGIWVTTQIVEASLDVDFDYLYTELSSLDSLFQRLGRCYRRREFNLKEPNIYVYTEELSGIGTIYNSEIFELSKAYIEGYDNKLITEEEKMAMVDELYSTENLELNGKGFIKEFKDALRVLDTIIDYDFRKREVQDMFREINNVKVIPYREYSNNISLFEKLKTVDDKSERLTIYRQINDLTIDMPVYRARNNISNVPRQYKLENLYILNLKYNSNDGILWGERISNLI